MGKVDTKESGIGFDVRVVSTEASRTLIWAMKVKAVRDGLEFIRGSARQQELKQRGQKQGRRRKQHWWPLVCVLELMPTDVGHAARSTSGRNRKNQDYCDEDTCETCF